MKDGRTTSSARRPVARPRLFISYRRRFDTPSARLLKKELARAFGDDAVFRDVDDIEAGEAFPETISEAIEDSDVFLLLVSPGWLESVGSLHNPEDFVRREVAAALSRQVPLVPLLLGEARMPKADELPEEIRDLAFRQAIELSDERWDYDVERLVKLIRARAALPGRASGFGRVFAPVRSFLGTRLGKFAAVAAVAAAAVLAFAVLWPRAILYGLRQNFEGCVSWHAPDVLGGAGRIELGEYAVSIVSADQYRRFPERRDEQGGVPLIVTLTASGKAAGAVFLRFQGADEPNESSFTVERVLAPPCSDVQDYRNESRPAGDKHHLKNWDTLRVSLGGRYYYLRTGDSGSHISATLSPNP